MTNRESFFVGEAATEKAVRYGVVWLSEWGDPSEDGIIVVPTKRQFRTTQLATVIGDRAAKALEQGNTFTLSGESGGRRVRGYTHRTIARFGRLGPTLVLWPGQKDLDSLLDCNIAALCVVPWIMEDIASWASSVGAINLLDGTTTPLPNKIADAVVEHAIVSLTSRVNLSTGLAHPRDKAAAVGMFRILKKGGHQWTGDEVAQRALAMGWKAKHARELGDMAGGMMEDRSYRAPGAGEMWAKDILKRWRKAAAED